MTRPRKRTAAATAIAAGAIGVGVAVWPRGTPQPASTIRQPATAATPTRVDPTGAVGLPPLGKPPPAFTWNSVTGTLEINAIQSRARGPGVWVVYGDQFSDDILGIAVFGDAIYMMPTDVSAWTWASYWDGTTQWIIAPDQWWPGGDITLGGEYPERRAVGIDGTPVGP